MSTDRPYEPQPRPAADSATAGGGRHRTSRAWRRSSLDRLLAHALSDVHKRSLGIPGVSNPITWP